MSNVAEGFGSSVGNSVGNNSAAITSQVVGTGQPVTLTFSDALAPDGLDGGHPQETANAKITNTFRVTTSDGTSH